MNNSLKKAFYLAKKTGDRVIVVDDNSEADAFVVMNIDEYERILSYKETYSRDIKGLTEDQLIDKINRDIALWKNEQEDAEAEGMDLPPTEEELQEEIEEESMYYYTEPEWNFLESLEDSRENDDQEGDSDSESGEDKREVEEEPEKRPDREKKESIFEKFNREQREYSEDKVDESLSKDWTGKNDWKIPFDVKAGADEVKE
jgi:hypothetical protein